MALEIYKPNKRVELPEPLGFRVHAGDFEFVTKLLQTTRRAKKASVELSLGGVGIEDPLLLGLGVAIKANSEAGNYFLSVLFMPPNPKQLNLDGKPFEKPEDFNIDEFTMKLKELTDGEYTISSRGGSANTLIHYAKDVNDGELSSPFFMFQTFKPDKGKGKGKKVFYSLNITDKLNGDGIKRFEQHYAALEKLIPDAVTAFYEAHKMDAPYGDFYLGLSDEQKNEILLKAQVDKDEDNRYI